MRKIPIRFKVVKNEHTIEAFFDERLSFNENMAILQQLSKENLQTYEIYDPFKMIFLERDVPIRSFELQGFPLFYLFT